MEFTQAEAGSSGGGGGEDPPDAEKIKKAFDMAAEKGTVDLAPITVDLAPVIFVPPMQKKGPLVPGQRPPGMPPMMPPPPGKGQTAKAFAKSRPTHPGVEPWLDAAAKAGVAPAEPDAPEAEVPAAEAEAPDADDEAVPDADEPDGMHILPTGWTLVKRDGVWLGVSVQINTSGFHYTQTYIYIYIYELGYEL